MLFAAFAAGSAANAEPLRATSDGGKYIIRIVPQESVPVAGRFETWTVVLSDRKRQPVGGARLLVGGGMRGHGHGLPTQPTAIAGAEVGSYLIEGLRFNMPGNWTLALSIEGSQGRDRVLFDIVVAGFPPTQSSDLSQFALDDSWQPPESVSNQYADDSAAASLGELLFNDQSLSSNKQVSCASCHRPDAYFVDGMKLGRGVSGVMRNTPSLIGASAQRWFYWDGRRDSLWSQALVPFEAEEEMGSSRVAVLRQILSRPDYRERYQEVFGTVPSIDFDALPVNAGPIGNAESRGAWFRLSRQQTNAINTAFANIGKALEAYQRTIKSPSTPFDNYVAGDAGDTGHGMGPGSGGHWQATFDSEAKRGLALFLDSEKTHCLRCHNGPWFTNQGFHNIGTGNFKGPHLDFGRVYGLQAALRDEFNCLGPYSDALPDGCKELRFVSKSSHVPLEGAFKVPTLRNLVHTAPYMHDGRYETLAEVIEHYRNPPLDGPPHELQPLSLSDEEVTQLVAFLESLSPQHDRSSPSSQ